MSKKIVLVFSGAPNFFIEVEVFRRKKQLKIKNKVVFEKQNIKNRLRKDKMNENYVLAIGIKISDLKINRVRTPKCGNLLVVISDVLVFWKLKHWWNFIRTSISKSAKNSFLIASWVPVSSKNTLFGPCGPKIKNLPFLRWKYIHFH